MGTKKGTNSQSEQNRIQPGHTYIGQLSEKQRKRSKNMIYKKNKVKEGTCSHRRLAMQGLITQ